MRALGRQRHAIEDDAAAVDHEARLHVGTKRHVALNGDQAVREVRRAAILGIGGLLDDHVDIARDDAPGRPKS